jgi:exopolysaccharide biosynthesis polyprenyl glycosylphosphotransferase
VGLAEQMCVDEIVVSSDSADLSEKLLAVLEACWGRGVAVVPAQLYFEQITGAVMIQHVGQNLFMLMNERDVCLQRVWDALRRALDIVIGLVGMLILAPLLPLIALAIYVDSPGPIFYRQERVGYGGRTFWIRKLRSMIPDAERAGAVWAKQGDDRITRVGRLLRKMRLDELPQLWNLLVGSMTLIGPRPERPEFVRQLSAELPYYAVRHYLKPGLTGWAQVRYHYGNSVGDALMKLQYDLYYVKHRGPLLDIIILLHTVRVVLALEGT